MCVGGGALGQQTLNAFVVSWAVKDYVKYDVVISRVCEAPSKIVQVRVKLKEPGKYSSEAFSIKSIIL